ncbi:MAG: KilA-N domain-containing protein [Nitratireductor sp.]
MTSSGFIVRSKRIRVDENELVCLNDIHRSAGFTKNSLPDEWFGSKTVMREISALIKTITGKTNNWTKEDIRQAYHVKRDKGQEIWAHENLALAYAAFLSADLAVEIRNIFLRYKRGDMDLADDVRRNNRKREDKLREQHRTVGKEVRKDYTSTLKEHGVSKGRDFGNCTNAVYKPVLGDTAKQLRIKKGLSGKSNLRDFLNSRELAYTMAAEALATERIEQANSNGFSECYKETKVASGAIGGAIDADRKNREPKLI